MFTLHRSEGEPVQFILGVSEFSFCDLVAQQREPGFLQDFLVILCATEKDGKYAERTP
jgi:hypothetical protein